MSADVVDFPGISYLDFDPDRILDAAKDAGLTSVVVVGYDEDGDERIFSSVAGGPEMAWMLDRAKYRLIKVVDDIAG